MPPDPSIRAVFLDIDGLLLNSEDVYVNCIQSLLAERSCLPMPEVLLACTMGAPRRFETDGVRRWMEKSVVGKDKWITVDDFVRAVVERCELERGKVEMLQGAEDLIRTLTTQAWTAKSHVAGKDCVGPEKPDLEKEKVEVALVSNTTQAKLKAKTLRYKEIFSLIPSTHVILHDDARLAAYSRAQKPAPDLYLAALDILNHEREQLKGMTKIRAFECLVFEDSVVGVEAGIKAGMRVVWVPHPFVREAYKGLERNILSGTLSAEDIYDPVTAAETESITAVSECNGVGKMGVMKESLRDFDFAEYGIMTI